jgi:hypothetical protein
VLERGVVEPLGRRRSTSVHRSLIGQPVSEGKLN